MQLPCEQEYRECRETGETGFLEKWIQFPFLHARLYFMPELLSCARQNRKAFHLKKPATEFVICAKLVTLGAGFDDVVLFIGVVAVLSVVAVATYGFGILSDFASISAPWLAIMFVCGAEVLIPPFLP